MRALLPILLLSACATPEPGLHAWFDLGSGPDRGSSFEVDCGPDELLHEEELLEIPEGSSTLQAWYECEDADASVRLLHYPDAGHANIQAWVQNQDFVAASPTYLLDPAEPSGTRSFRGEQYGYYDGKDILDTGTMRGGLSWEVSW